MQQPQRYCRPSFRVNRISLSDDRIDDGVSARVSTRVDTVDTDTWNKKNKRVRQRAQLVCSFKRAVERLGYSGENWGELNNLTSNITDCSL